MFYQKRVGKKKALTDPVKIISFPGQNEKQTKSEKKLIVSKKNTEDLPRPSLNREAKVLKAPTGNLKSSYLSIKELQNAEVKKENKQQDLTADKPKNNFSFDDLKMAWRKFAYKSKENGLDTLFTAMTSRDPQLESDYEVIHTVDNGVQQTFVVQNETSILTFLRQELQNWSISLTVNIETEENSNKQLYSGQDKFKDMAERNPHLKTLQQRFKLDIDF